MSNSYLIFTALQGGLQAAKDRSHQACQQVNDPDDDFWYPVLYNQTTDELDPMFGAAALEIASSGFYGAVWPNAGNPVQVLTNEEILTLVPLVDLAASWFKTVNGEPFLVYYQGSYP